MLINNYLEDIGNDVGSDSKILSELTISNDCIIGANSLVTKDVPDYTIVGGNPSKLIKYRFVKETINKLLKIKWWDFNEDELIEIIPQLQSKNIKN